MTNKQHVHRLRRKKYPTGNAVYHCTNNCTFKIECELALGLVVLCNYCGEPFQMNEYSIRLKIPHCVNCGRTKVTTTTGETKYIRKQKENPVLRSTAADKLDDLQTALRDLADPNERDI